MLLSHSSKMDFLLGSKENPHKISKTKFKFRKRNPKEILSLGRQFPLGPTARWRSKSRQNYPACQNHLLMQTTT